MSDQTRIDLKLNRWRQASSWGRTVPYYFRHRWRRPYRLSPEARAIDHLIAAAEYRNSARQDMACNVFLDGYMESTRLRTSPGTGLALVLYSVWIHAFDDEFDRMISFGAAPTFATVNGTTVVNGVWTALAEYLRSFGCETSVGDYLGSLIEANYDGYCDSLVAAKAGLTFDRALQVAHYDSGIAVRTLYHIIRLFNRHPLDQMCSDEFYSMGMAGKLCDDMADIEDDLEGVGSNLLIALAREDSSIAGRLAEARSTAEPITYFWWSENFPGLLEAYFGQVTKFYDQIRSRSLRLAIEVHVTILLTRYFWRHREIIS